MCSSTLKNIIVSTNNFTYAQVLACKCACLYPWLKTEQRRILNVLQRKHKGLYIHKYSSIQNLGSFSNKVFGPPLFSLYTSNTTIVLFPKQSQVVLYLELWSCLLLQYYIQYQCLILKKYSCIFVNVRRKETSTVK